MTRRFVMGQYCAVSSLLHALDPRVKLTLLFANIVMAFVASTLPMLALLFVPLLAAMGAARIPLAALLRALAPFLFLLIFPLIFNVVLVQAGEVLLSIGVLRITTGGVYQAAFMILRLLLLFTTAVLLTLTTTGIALCDAVAYMLAPFKRFGFPVFELALMVAIALRFVPQLSESFEHIRKAHAARGSDLSAGSPIARLRVFSPIMVALFAQAFIKAEELAQAMESRCYNGNRRTHYHVLFLSLRDVVALLLYALVAVCVFVWRCVAH